MTHPGPIACGEYMLEFDGHILELVNPRPWLTNLDFINAKLTFARSLQATDIWLNLIGTISITKTVFGTSERGIQEYHIVNSQWNFLNKETVIKYDPQEKIYSAAYMANVSLQIGTCPLHIDQHLKLPPSTGIQGPQSNKQVKMDYDNDTTKIVYKIVAIVKNHDEKLLEVDLPFKFVPTADPSAPAADEQGSTRTPALSQSQKAIPGERKRGKHTSGGLSLSCTVSQDVSLSSDFTTCEVNIDCVMSWAGSHTSAPVLSAATASILVLQSSFITHPMPADFTKPIQIAELSCDPLVTQQIVQEEWSEVESKKAQKLIRCKVRVTSEKFLQPSYSCCLAERAYKIRLKLTFNNPSSILNRHRTVSEDVPVRLVSTIPVGPDPSDDFMEMWVKQCYGGTYRNYPIEKGPGLLKFWKSPSRIPDYTECSSQLINPAPLRTTPRYTDPTSVEEELRIPAWQLKEEEHG